MKCKHGDLLGSIDDGAANLRVPPPQLATSHAKIRLRRGFIRRAVVNRSIAAITIAMIGARCHGGTPSPGPRTVAVEEGRYGRIVYVSATSGSNDAGNGSQTEPWQTIQHALSQTHDASAVNRVALMVAAGTYEKETIQMKEYVDLFGGFRPDDWHRDVLQQTTVLDGGTERRVLVGVDHSRLDGFVIQRGLVRGRGAALLCDGVSPTVTNNRFVENKTQKPKDWRPLQLHELAHDGGAICCLNRASPRIAHNVFADNRTEIGRGAAIALHGHCVGEISSNIFLDNETGTADSHRSSDGGAISVFDWSSPRIEKNVLLENKTHNTNDGGAIFVALWSSPVIRKNIFVGNRSADDGGALFVGGQEHRYDQSKDPLPERDDFHVMVSDNVFFGNENKRHDSGGMRLAMEARVSLQNNVLARDARLYVQDSAVEIVNNTIVEDTFFRDMSPWIAHSLVVNNIFWGQLRLSAGGRIDHSNVRDGYAGTGNFSAEPRFAQDQKRFDVTSATYDGAEHATALQVTAERLEPDVLANRIVRVDHRWGVVKANRANEISVWGDISGRSELHVLPTFQLDPESPCIDRGAAEHAPKQDIHGDPRPSGAGVDIGADEVMQP